MCTHMGSINISLKKEAYDFLNSIRKKDQSFSEIILEFKKEKKFTGKDLLKYAGVLNEERAEEIKREIKNNRKSFEKELNKRIKNDRP